MIDDHSWPTLRRVLPARTVAFALVVLGAVFITGVGCSLDYGGFSVQPGAAGGSDGTGFVPDGGAGVAVGTGGAATGGGSVGDGAVGSGGVGGALGGQGGNGVAGAGQGGNGVAGAGQGGNGVAGAGQGGGGLDKPTCLAQYGSTPEFQLCAETSAGCEFYVGNAESCQTMCANLGGECVDAWDNVGICGMGATLGCLNQGLSHLVCSCSRGCGAGPACTAAEVCAGGTCQ